MSLARCRIAEEDIEGIHRTVSNIKAVATTSSAAWCTATHCLDQNLAIVDGTLALPMGPELVRSEWQRYKRCNFVKDLFKFSKSSTNLVFVEGGVGGWQ